MRQIVTYTLMGLWIPMVIGVVGTLMVGHTVAMPGPSDHARVAAEVAELSPSPDGVVHFIPADCSCTDGLVRHLQLRRARADRDELVVFIGRPKPHHLAVAEVGYRTETWTAQTLFELTGLEAGPVLAVRQDGQVRYLGGYFQFPAAVHSLDISLIDGVAEGETPEPLPLFGCAVSEALQRAVDPLGVGR